MTPLSRVLNRMFKAARPCEVPFLFATFSLGMQRKSRFNTQKSMNYFLGGKKYD